MENDDEKRNENNVHHLERAEERSEGSQENAAGNVPWDARSITALLSLCLLWVGECSP